MTATLPEATLDAVASKKKPASSPELEAARELVRQAREQGLSLTGPDGLLKQMTKTVLETALNEELTEHLGYAKHDPVGSQNGNVRNGTRSKTVLTEANGHVQIDVPRPETGLIKFPYRRKPLRSWVAPVTGDDRRDPDIAYFLAANQDWLDGDELACLGVIDFRLLLRSSRKFRWRR